MDSEALSPPGFAWGIMHARSDAERPPPTMRARLYLGLCVAFSDASLLLLAKQLVIVARQTAIVMRVVVQVQLQRCMARLGMAIALPPNHQRVHRDGSRRASVLINAAPRANVGPTGVVSPSVDCTDAELDGPLWPSLWLMPSFFSIVTLQRSSREVF